MKNHRSSHAQHERSHRDLNQSEHSRLTHLKSDMKLHQKENEIQEKARQEIADGLSVLLADSYFLYLRTHNYHWNVTGPLFFTLHQLFMNQYQELALGIDSIAERIRSMGFIAPATFSEFVELTSIKEVRGAQKPERMIASLCEGQDSVIKTARDLIPTAESLEDYTSVDLLISRIQVHEKNAWMLRSLMS